jgi:Tfp pilus assembly protein FimT
MKTRLRGVTTFNLLMALAILSVVLAFGLAAWKFCFHSSRPLRREGRQTELETDSSTRMSVRSGKRLST